MLLLYYNYVTPFSCTCSKSDKYKTSSGGDVISLEIGRPINVCYVYQRLNRIRTSVNSVPAILFDRCCYMKVSTKSVNKLVILMCHVCLSLENSHEVV